ncbi:peroxiredoxin Q [Amylostereum chailletii]|nr:peroxiredoxin Q [Amylostereum chailletii]
MPHPLVGKKAPSLSLPKQDGEVYNFNPGTQGAPVAVFFVPDADSFGCSREICGFRDALVDQAAFTGSKISLIGIGPNTVEQMKMVADKQKVTYPMLSDDKGEARKAYSVGRGLMGLTEGRVTFFLDKEGVVRDVMDSVINYNGHIKFVNKCLQDLEAEEKKAAATTTS